MPIYEYQCTECQERQEVIQRFSDPPLTECTHCGGSMRKLPSSPAIQFKGSGFYKTDYAAPGAKGSDKTAAGSEASAGKSEAPASKSETPSSPAAPAAGTKPDA
jgi:putative FmdB family regulatory protein